LGKNKNTVHRFGGGGGRWPVCRRTKAILTIYNNVIVARKNKKFFLYKPREEKKCDSRRPNVVDTPVSINQ
jgi:hypothetical protein